MTAAAAAVSLVSMKWLRPAALVTLGFLVVLLVLAVTLYLVHGLVRAREVADARRQAVADLTAALPSAQRQATTQQDRVRAAVARSELVERVPSLAGTPAYSWQELQCGIETDEGGWIVQNYAQQCDVRTVSLYPAASATAGDCELLYVPGAIRATSGIVDIWRGRSDALISDRAVHNLCPNDLTAPPPFDAARLLSGRRPTELTTAPAWVAVTLQTPVSRTDLGCSPWGILFCENPVDGAVLDDSDL